MKWNQIYILFEPLPTSIWQQLQNIFDWSSSTESTTLLFSRIRIGGLKLKPRTRRVQLMMCNRLIESWSNAYNGMLTDSRGTSRWRHRYWHRANLMPRADRDRYGGSVTAIPATSLWPSIESLPPFHVSPLVSRLGWLIGPLRLHHRFHPLWGFGGRGGPPFDPAVSNPFLRFRPPVCLFSSPGPRNCGKKTESEGIRPLRGGGGEGRMGTEQA